LEIRHNSPATNYIIKGYLVVVCSKLSCLFIKKAGQFNTSSKNQHTGSSHFFFSEISLEKQVKQVTAEIKMVNRRLVFLHQ
jgi:hypothetical protein